MDADGVRKLLTIKVERDFQSPKQAAERIGIDANHLTAIMAGRQTPGLRVLKYLGLKKVLAYDFERLPPKD